MFASLFRRLSPPFKEPPCQDRDAVEQRQKNESLCHCVRTAVGVANPCGISVVLGQ